MAGRGVGVVDGEQPWEYSEPEPAGVGDVCGEWRDRRERRNGSDRGDGAGGRGGSEWNEWDRWSYRGYRSHGNGGVGVAGCIHLNDELCAG